MIIWHQNVINHNVNYERQLIGPILANDKKHYQEQLDNHNTYTSTKSPVDAFLAKFYKRVLSQIMSDLGLEHRTQYTWEYWTQVYQGNENSNHGLHDHFAHSTILSWVHFIKPAAEDCFCFVDSKGNETYPPTQRQNDLIVFPSWVAHRVTPFKSDKTRAVVAGNISIDSIGPCGAGSELTTTVTLLNNGTSVWQLS